MRANFALDYDVLTVEQPQKLYLMAYLTAGPAPTDRQRRPLNISLVVDRSGSMAGDKIEYTRQAAQLLVQNLGVNDTLSIVLYNDHVETLLQPERVQRKDVINQHIKGIKPGGTTNLSGGWLQGCGLVAQNLNADQLNRVILMTDGLANRGVTQSDKLIALAQQKRAEGISTTTMGLGSDFNEDLLMNMANAGGGAFYFIESPEVTPVIFQEELQGLLSVVGQNLVISVDQTEFIAEVKQLNAYPTERIGRRVAFRLGDVFGDEVKALLIELSIPALKEIGQRQIATLRFEYDELGDTGSQHQVWEMPVMVNVAPSGAMTAPEGNREVRRSVLLLQAAQARRQAVEAADKGKYGDAAKALRDAVDRIATSALDDQQLNEEQTALQKQADEMEKGASMYDEYSRKSMSTQAFYTMSSRHDDTVVLRLREQQREQAQQAKEGKALETLESHQIKVSDVQAALAESPTPLTGSDLTVKTPVFLHWQDKHFPLKGDAMSIGRSTENDIIIPVKGVSRVHVLLKREEGLLVLTDNNSTNGTLVNGVPLASQQRHVLKVGDEVTLCDEKLLFNANEVS
ncbi:MAG: VWA domain-containing protein [Armatimonadetes bacterium]|nr:VWA domain-containing protein [Anaerolineae bacterium]